MTEQEEIGKCSSVGEALDFLKYRERHPEASLQEFQSYSPTLLLDEAYVYYGRRSGKTLGALFYLLYQQRCRSRMVLVGTVTGRLSCSTSNIKELPRKVKWDLRSSPKSK